MKSIRIALAATALAVTAAAASPAWADRGRGGYYRPQIQHHHHGNAGLITGLVLGSAVLWAATRPAPVYYPPEPVVVRTPVYVSPPVYSTPAYVEPPTIVQAEPAQPVGWWYYCQASRTYYPYVKTCPGGWVRVPAQPPEQ